MARKNIDLDLARAAEMRVAGEKWTTIGAELERSPNVCKQWPSRHPEKWKEFFAQAEAQQLIDVKCESMLTLRQLLRSISDPVRQKAAEALLEIAQTQADKNAARANLGPQTEVRQLIAYLEGLSDDQFRALFDEPGDPAALAPSPAPPAVKDPESPALAG